LGSGATLFAAEHDSGTYAFQRSLPVSASRLLTGKLGFSLASAVVLPPVLWLIALSFAGGKLPRPDEHLVLWLGGITTLLEVFAWSVLFSLLLRRVLWSVVLAALGPCFFSFALLPQLFLSIPTGRLGAPFDEYTAALPVRALVAILVFAADIWLGRRWLREYPMPWSRPRVSRRQATSTMERDKAAQATRGLVLGRLVWQTWRQSRMSISLILGGLAAFSAYLIIVNLINGHEALSMPLAMFPFVAGVLGCCVYWADQRRQQFRFLTDRGVGPRTVWFSRQIVWISALLVWLAVSVVCMAIEMTRSISVFQLHIVTDAFRSPQYTNFRIRTEAIDMALRVLGLGLLTYSISQACSLFFRSGIIALAMGMFCSVMLCLWAMLMWMLEVPLWFAVLPIPLIALWASWLRAPDWLSERTRWRARLKLVFSLAFPLAAVLVATACFRAYEVPVVQLDLPDANPRQPSSDARETLRIYHEAWLASESRATKDEAIAKFLEASRRKHCWFPNAYDLHRASHAGTMSDDAKNAQTLATYPARLAGYVRNSCDSLESDGNLDAAFERYMAVLRFARHLYYRGDLRRQRGADAVEAIALERLRKWAASPGQSADNIRAALQRLDQEYFVFSPSREYEMLDDYRARLKRYTYLV
jgi:ABC-type transport system involved in multi-copper enzyme maturation permease subunit